MLTGRGDVTWSRERKSPVHYCGVHGAILRPSEVQDRGRGAAQRREGETQPYDVHVPPAGRAGKIVPSDSLPGHLHEGETS